MLLVSGRFLKSEFIMARELPAITARAGGAALRVVWIPIAIERQALIGLPQPDGVQAVAGFDEMRPADPDACPEGACALFARMADRGPARRLDSPCQLRGEPGLACDLKLVLACDRWRRCVAQPRFDRSFFARFQAEFLHRYPDATPFFRAFDAQAWQR